MKIKSLFKTLSLLSPAIALAFTVSSTALCADESKLTSKDKSFITDASEAGAAEVESANLALKKSSNADIKTFAEMMVKDHTKAGEELKKIATGKGGSPSDSPGTVQKAKILLLETKSKNFDKDYAEQALKDHQEAVALFEKASTDLDDADLKEFAKKTLPTLKEHLAHAEKLAAKFGK